MNEFEQLVYEMRAAQINYFRTRSEDALKESKQLEKRVDKYLLDIIMNEVSIIINGVRYDAVEKPEYKEGIDVCNGCDICELYEVKGITFPCSKIIGSKRVFKKSTKSFER